MVRRVTAAGMELRKKSRFFFGMPGMGPRRTKFPDHRGDFALCLGFGLQARRAWKSVRNPPRLASGIGLTGGDYLFQQYKIFIETGAAIVDYRCRMTIYENNVARFFAVNPCKGIFA